MEGDISSEGVLSVGQNAVIRAEINTKSVIIHGKVIGNVTVTDRVELKSTAELVGDIQAASLAIEGGAIFIGHSTVGAPTVGATGLPPPRRRLPSMPSLRSRKPMLRPARARWILTRNKNSPPATFRGGKRTDRSFAALFVP